MKKLFFIVLALFAHFALQAQSLSVGQVQAPEKVPFAKPFTIGVRLVHPAGQEVTWVPDSVPADFAVINVALQPLSPTDTQADLTVMPFVLEKSTFTVAFALKTQPQASVPAEVPLTVEPVQLFTDKKLREIRPPPRAFDWALWLCILLALIALVCLIIWWVRRIQADAAHLQAEPDNRPAHIIALSQIDALVDSGLWEDKQYKLFYITLTDILRNYLQRAFGLDVSADTSAELLRHLKTLPDLTAFIQDLRLFLSSGDLVKFAKAIPAEPTRNRDITLLRQFIKQTAPAPAPQIPQQVEVKL